MNRTRALPLALLALLLTGARASAAPVLDFSQFVSNLQDTPQQFTIVFPLPFSGGPFDTLESQFSSTASDGGDGVVEVSPLDASGAMMVPNIDGGIVGTAALGAGCTLFGPPFFFNAPCDALSTASAALLTPAAGSLNATVSFLLSGGDSLTFQGRLALNTVPEPATALLLSLGVGLAALRRRLSS